MSEKRCLKLVKKIAECKQKGLHPKVIRRLERKLDCASIRVLEPKLTSELHRVFQSAKATLDEIYKIADEVIPESVLNSNFLDRASKKSKKVVNPKDIKVKVITYRELLEENRKVYIDSTRMDSSFRMKTMRLCGLLVLFSHIGYDLMGITKNDFNFDPYFTKCGVLVDQLCDIVYNSVRE